MKAKEKPLTAKQLKARNNYDRMSFVPVTQVQKKWKASSIDINHYIDFNADKLSELIKQIESTERTKDIGIRLEATLKQWIGERDSRKGKGSNTSSSNTKEHRWKMKVKMKTKSKPKLEKRLS